MPGPVDVPVGRELLEVGVVVALKVEVDRVVSVEGVLGLDVLVLDTTVGRTDEEVVDGAAVPGMHCE